MSEELKPCPICGGPAELWKAHENRAAWVACMGKCSVYVTNGKATTEEAIAAWNQRAKPRVKALEFFKWKRAGGGYHEGQLSANTQAGNYAIMHHESKGLYYLVCPDSTEYYDTLDKAAAAAQVDFTRRVHACLEGYDHVED